MKEQSAGRRARVDREAAAGPALAPGKRTRVPDQVPGRGGRGSALPPELRGRLEGSLDADLAGVQVHTGGESAEAAEALDARAFTVGQSIHFGAGEYNPESPAGQELIAHEVAHTVQQQGAADQARGADDGDDDFGSLEVSKPSDAHEVEAKRFGREFADGKRREGGTGAPVGAQVGAGTVSRAMIQREEKPPAAPPEKESGGGLGGLFSVDQVAGEIEMGEASLKKFKLGPYIDGEAKASYGVEFEFERKPGFTGNAPSASAVKAGIMQHIKQLIASAWVNAEWEKQAKVGTDLKSVTLAPALVLSTKVGPVPIELTAFEISLIDYEPGKKLKVPKVTLPALEIAVPSHPFEVMGFQGTIAPTGTLAVELSPDYLEFGKWALRHLASMITADVLLAAGVIAGGAAAIVGGLVEISRSGEVTARTERAAGGAKSYVAGWVDGAGLAKGKAKKPPKDAAAYAQGRSAATTWLGSMLTKYPEGMVREYVDKKGLELRAMAWGSIWPTLEKTAWDSYWADHGWFDREFMGYGAGGPNYNNFRRVLEAIRSKGG